MSRNSLPLTTAIALCLGSAAWAQPVLVTSTADSGEGSLRAAIEALAETGGTIAILAEGDVQISSTLDYTGSAPLSIIGNGTVISTAEDVTLLQASGGASLSLTGLTLAGPGGWSIENRADTDGTSGKGVFIDVADDATGVVALTMTDVTVRGVANHGVHISDCTLADACGSGGGGAGEGSAASVSVTLSNVTIDDAGNGKFDADGLRVDERGPGNIVAVITGSTFRGMGADGVELDEGQTGDVHAMVSGSLFEANGIYCLPETLAAFLPEEDEGEFADNARTEDSIPGPVTGSPDDGCFEREVDTYDSGFVEEFAFGIDVDDGFDIDEAGPGDLVVSITGSRIVDNLDEGADFDEEGPGAIRASFINTIASGNTDDGFKNSEEDEGGVYGIMIGATAMDNGGKGAVFEEEGAGDVVVAASGVMAKGNDDSDGTGLELVQEDDGMGRATVTASDIADGYDLDGVAIN